MPQQLQVNIQCQSLGHPVEGIKNLIFQTIYYLLLYIIIIIIAYCCNFVRTTCDYLIFILMKIFEYFFC